MIRSPFTPSQHLLVALACLFAAPLAAQSPTAIQELLDRGDYEKAVNQSAAYLEEHPGDAQVRFLRGLALARLDRREAAIETFGELTRDYPEAPEPANNLAVLYAQQGDYDKARRWLEAAMSTHPAYATAHKNLGDVYTALAAAAYSKALEEQDRADLGVSLDFVAQMDLPREEGAAVAAAEEREMRVVPAPEPHPEPARPPERTPAESPAAEPSPGGPPPAEQTEESPSEADRPAAGAEGEVMNAVQAWAQAWSNQDVESYLQAYADNFYPGDGLTLAQWREQRRERVSAPGRISVKIVEPRVSFPEQGRARVVFEQDYESDTYSDRVTKTLILEQRGADWRIVREISE